MVKRQHNLIRANFRRACIAHLFIGVAFVAQLIAYDASKLITPDVLLKRWIVTSIFIFTAGLCWYLARLNDKPAYIHRLTVLLIAIDIFVAAFSVYTQRGMASRAVFLFTIPILLAATLERKGAIYLTTLLAVVVYLAVSIAYFVLNFNEGYKIELYGEIGFYSVLLFITGNLCWTLVRHKH